MRFSIIYLCQNFLFHKQFIHRYYSFMLHPIHRFDAPNTITRGFPLKNLMSPHLVELIAESFQYVYGAFDMNRFMTNILPFLEGLELKERAKCIA